MEVLATPFLPFFPQNHHTFSLPSHRRPKPSLPPIAQSHDPAWTLSDGNNPTPKPYIRNPKKAPLAGDHDHARHLIHSRADDLRRLRRGQGPYAQPPRWVRRKPGQMKRLVEDDRGGLLHGKHVVAAIRAVRALAGRPKDSYNMREVMGPFVATLTFKEMCAILKAQRSWRLAGDFFAWMKLQLSYRPSVAVYTIMLRIYGEIGKIEHSERIFLEMLDAGCEPDEVACGTLLCAYARWGRHEKMLTFYNAVRRRKILPPVTVFNFMISSLQKQKLHGKAIELWMLMLDAGAKPDHFTYTLAVSSYVKGDLLDEAIDIFRKMRNSKLNPEEATYSLLISANAKKGKWNEALNLYEDMKSLCIIPSNYTCASLLTIYYKTGDYSKATSLLSMMERNKIALDEVIYGILVRIYGKLGLYEDAEKAFEDAGRLGVFKEEKTYMAMVQVHLDAGNSDEALKIFDLMRSKNVELTAFSYYALLRCYIAKEDVDSAEITIQSLFKFGKPDAVSCTEMLTLYVKMKLLERAVALISQIRKVQVQFDENLYRTVLHIYCKAGKVSDVEELLQQMVDEGLNLDKFTKTSLMAMYGNAGGIQRAENLFKALDTPDLTAFGVMLTLYIKNGNLVRSKEILSSLLERIGGLSLAGQLTIKFAREGDVASAKALHNQVLELGYILEDPAISSLISSFGWRQQLHEAESIFSIVSNPPRIWSLSYCSMVDAYVKCGEVDKASHLFRYMVDNAVAFNAFTVSMVVNALTEHGKFKEAENIIFDALKGKAELDTVAYNTFIKAMLESGLLLFFQAYFFYEISEMNWHASAGRLHLASSIYNQMISAGISPSIQTYNTMISVYGRGGKLDMAIKVFNTARCMCTTLDEKTYTNMISYYGKDGRTKEASLLFREMQDEGIKPGKITYNAMLNAYATVGLYDEAECLLKLMRQAGNLPDSVTYLALVRSYVKSDKCIEGEELIHRMKQDGIIPSCTHFNQLIFFHTKNGNIKDAEKICNSMQQLGLSLDLAGCRSLLRAYMEYGLVDKGISFYQNIKGTVKPDGLILSAAVHLLTYRGMTSEARDIIHFMNEERIVFLKSLKVGSKAMGATIS